MACMKPFVATLSVSALRASLTRTSDDEADECQVRDGFRSRRDSARIVVPAAAGSEPIHKCVI